MVERGLVVKVLKKAGCKDFSPKTIANMFFVGMLQKSGGKICFCDGKREFVADVATGKIIVR